MESVDDVSVRVNEFPEHDVDFEQPVAAYEELSDEDESVAVPLPADDPMDVEHIIPLNEENNPDQDNEQPGEQNFSCLYPVYISFCQIHL